MTFWHSFWIAVALEMSLAGVVAAWLFLAFRLDLPNPLGMLTGIATITVVLVLLVVALISKYA